MLITNHFRTEQGAYRIQAFKMFGDGGYIMRNFLMKMLLVDVLGICCAFLIGRYISRRMLKPVEAIRTAAGTKKDETVRRRLNVLLMRCDGYTVREIAERTGLQIDSIFKMCQRYREEGLESFATNKYGGNHRALSEEQERRILSRFEKAAVAGQPVQAMEIKAAFDQARGRETGCGYIYMLLKRHGWRRVTEKSTSAHAPAARWVPETLRARG